MNSTELTKLTGAVLVGGLVLLTSSILAKNLVSSHSEGEVAMAVPHGTEGTGDGGAAPEAPAGDALEPVSGLIAAADLAAGEAAFKKCTSCHSIEKGGHNKVGPNLWGIVGNKHAHAADFPNYSDGLKNLPGNWDFEGLNAWIHSPKSVVSDTKMSFPGLKKTQDRANLIAWLNTQSDAPLPVPAAAPAAAESGGTESTGAASGSTSGQTAQATTTESTAPATGEQTAATGGDLSSLLKAADPAAGDKVAAKCKACHDFTKGGPNKVGPNLWGVIGAKHAHMADYNYTDALKALADKQWSFEEIDKFLTSPKEYAPGTKMTFPGLKKPDDRANVIIWLNQQSDAPLPLPAGGSSDASGGTTGEAATATAATTEAAPAAPAPAATTEATPPPATPEPAAPAPATPPAAATTEATTETPPAAGGSFADLLKAADPAAGQKVAAKCKACHDFTKDGPNKVGPNLWDIIGAKHAHKADYDYSAAIKGMADKDWTYEELDKFLTGPKDYAPGTKMTFAGIKKPEDRAALIAWLRSLSDSPKPLP